uniref:Phosphoinositide phospholipase C n=1 Tax=Daucus carota subsp. sativus TaxID=79200 RepID=A0A162AIV1_DAUCS
MGSYKMFGIFNRKFKTEETGPPEDVVNAFTKYSDGGKEMSADQLLRFLVEFQGQADCTLSHAQDIMKQLHHLSDPNFLSINDFCYFLVNEQLNPPISHQIHQDMDSPLSHYFIYTGHNSYLTGNQLSSDCSDAPIIEALQNGVRVIELDIWPNSSGDDVNVLHGRTLTTPVKLLKCLSSIKEHAFVASEYPVVITLEDHLTPELQAKVADMVTQTFGEALFVPDSEGIKQLKSPNSMKKRFIISTKPPKEYLQAKKVDKDETNSPQKVKDGDEGAWGKELTSLKLGTTRDKVDPDKVRRLSLSEPELEKAVATHGKAIVSDYGRGKHTKVAFFEWPNYLPGDSQVHPAEYIEGVPEGYTFRLVELQSTDCLDTWSSDGCIQYAGRASPGLARITTRRSFGKGYGRSLWLMHGMFRANGGCGYIKKPDFLLKAGPDNEIFDPETALPPKTKLKVTLYTGEGWYNDFKDTHYDSYSPPDFYARIGIAGVEADTVMKKTKTQEDTWIPNWNEEFEFPLTIPELALLRVEVHEYDMSEKDDFGGQTCLPVSELRSGIRAVPLHSKTGDKYNSVKVLMRFEFV